MNKKKNIRAMIDTVKIAYKLYKAAVVLTVVSAVISAVKPYVAILLSAYILNGLTSGKSFGNLITAAAIGLGMIFILHVSTGFIDKINRVQIEVCVRRYNMEMCKKTLTMDYELLESPAVNDIRMRIKNDDNWGAGFYSVFWQFWWLVECFFSFIPAIIILIPLFLKNDFFSSRTTSLYLVFLFLITISVAVFNSKYINKKVFALMDEVQKGSPYFGYFVYGWKDYKSGKDLRIYDASRLIKQYMDDISDWRRSWKRRFTIVEGTGGFISGLASGILQGGAYLFVVLRAVAGALTVGTVVKYAATIFAFANNLSNFMNAFTQFAETSKRQQSTLDYINLTDVLYKGTLPIEKRNDNEYEIEFNKVSFKYPSSDTYVLRNISLKLKIGERMAVVGMNGSGKTTMIKLLCRLYDPTEGEITLNGIDIKKYDYNEYLSIFSVVFQDFRLFSFPLGQNVATNVEYDRDKIVDCLSKAGLGERYKTMEQGVDSFLYKDFDEKGIEISGGEAQKIALARALYKDAPFIVLDEPTAALDPIAEFEIYTKFNEIVGNKTAIYISHRLSSCRFCDDIVVFHEGQIIQRGNHNILVADRNGKYYELWNAQAQYYEK
jgi:ATP-binding cassette, subfamily B, bacterial